MAPDKVTIMILDVDLQCSSCYKKVKKVLCKFPQIRDQVFDQGKNKVKITVVCCSPEKIRDKLCCKGGKAIQRIEIVEEKPKPKPTKPDRKPAKPDQPDPKPTEPEPNPNPEPNPQREPCLRPVPPPPPPVPIRVCCSECSEGQRGGPCEYRYERPVPPPPGPCYCGCPYGYGGSRPCYVSRCDYFEENPRGCSIM